MLCSVGNQKATPETNPLSLWSSKPQQKKTCIPSSWQVYLYMLRVAVVVH